MARPTTALWHSLEWLTVQTWFLVILGILLATLSIKSLFLHAVVCSALGASYTYYFGLPQALRLNYLVFVYGLPAIYAYLHYLNWSVPFTPPWTRQEIGFSSIMLGADGLISAFAGAMISFLLGALTAGPTRPRGPYRPT